MPPAIGATQNSHSCCIAQPPTKIAWLVLRAGFTEVFVTGMLIRWISVRPRPMAIGARAGGRALIGGAENDHQEKEGQHDFTDQRSLQAVATRRVFAETVRSESALHEVEVGLAGRDGGDHQRTERRTDDLGHDIGQYFSSRHLACRPQPERHRRVQVTAGDMPDGKSHGQHRQSEGQRHTDKADTEFREAGSEYGTAAATEHQPRRTEQFRTELSDHIGLS